MSGESRPRYRSALARNILLIVPIRTGGDVGTNAIAALRTMVASQVGEIRELKRENAQLRKRVHALERRYGTPTNLSRIVRAQLRRDAHRSDASIAATAGCCRQLVYRVRAALEAAKEIPKTVQRKGLDGETQPIQSARKRR